MVGINPSEEVTTSGAVAAIRAIGARQIRRHARRERRIPQLLLRTPDRTKLIECVIGDGGLRLVEHGDRGAIGIGRHELAMKLGLIVVGVVVELDHRIDIVTMQRDASVALHAAGVLTEVPEGIGPQAIQRTTPVHRATRRILVFSLIQRLINRAHAIGAVGDNGRGGTRARTLEDGIERTREAFGEVRGVSNQVIVVGLTVLPFGTGVIDDLVPFRRIQPIRLAVAVLVGEAAILRGEEQRVGKRQLLGRTRRVLLHLRRRPARYIAHVSTGQHAAIRVARPQHCEFRAAVLLTVAGIECARCGVADLQRVARVGGQRLRANENLTFLKAVYIVAAIR